jgi:hypothetical protein
MQIPAAMSLPRPFFTATEPLGPVHRPLANGGTARTG